ncbi:hypothetical protein [Polaromonas sp. AER18D-145]|uniref:hypothetical protein n=1 Tax=Polaromonas sp. AER18D-145 TaxID=1977060 RepID=UPI000BBB6D72|nr:hypothetical protein [Polaromonas sp. AER18D-145]
MLQAQSLQVLAPLIRALGFLQMIEEGLKLYVGTAEELIQAATPYGVPFKVDRKAIENAPLGKLIGMFAKLNRNDQLIARLRQLPEHRNHIAHAAFKRAFQASTDKNIDLEYAKRHATEVGDEAEKVLLLIGQEMRSLLANFPNSKTASLFGDADA